MMMPPMQKMAAPLALASALCHVATIAVIGNMHIQSSTLRDTPAGPHRALLDSDGDSLVTVAHMTKAVDPRAVIGSIRVETKTGGKTGDWAR